MDIVSGQGPPPAGDTGNAHLEAGDVLQRSLEGNRRYCRSNAMTTKFLMKWLAGLALAALTTIAALAQSDFPNRPIRMLVPFAAGGGIDITARITAQSLSDVLGQQVVVQNQGGAGGALATDAVARAEPDG